MECVFDPVVWLTLPFLPSWSPGGGSGVMKPSPFGFRGEKVDV